MFATLSYTKGDSDNAIQLLPASVENFGGRRPVRLACLECHSKKVKCTGDRSGCAKCKSSGIPCVYPATSERRGPRKRRANTASASTGGGNNNTNNNNSSSSSIGEETRTPSSAHGSSTSPMEDGNGTASQPDSHAPSITFPELARQQGKTVTASGSLELADTPPMSPLVDSISSTVDDLLLSLTPLPFDLGSLTSPTHSAPSSDDIMFQMDLDSKRGSSSDGMAMNGWPAVGHDEYCWGYDHSTLPYNVTFADHMQVASISAASTPLKAPHRLDYGVFDSAAPHRLSAAAEEPPPPPPPSASSSSAPGTLSSTSSSSAATGAAATDADMPPVLQHALADVAFLQHQYHSSSRPCLCSMAAVRLLEVLHTYQDRELSTDVVLRTLKASLDQLRTWLACETCTTPNAIAMMMALIIDRLLTYLEKGVAQHVRKLQRAREEEQDKDACERAGGAVGNYQIESRTEWVRVMGVLLQVKSEEMSDAIAHLSEHAAASSILAGCDRRIKRILSELSSWEK